eukprot:933666-Amphidinium_carterae.1
MEGVRAGFLAVLALQLKQKKTNTKETCNRLKERNILRRTMTWLYEHDTVMCKANLQLLHDMPDTSCQNTLQHAGVEYPQWKGQ